MIENPKTYWEEIAQRGDWRDYILPRKHADDFEFEGWMEAQRFTYFYDESSVVVDYGCGIGRVLQYVSQKAKRAIGLDVALGMLERAMAYVDDPNVELIRVEEFIEIDVADFVYSLMVMQHNSIENQGKIARHIHDILKVGGIAIIHFPRHESTFYGENETCHKFTKEEIGKFGELFSSYRIIDGNLPNYQRARDDMNHEYFLVGVK